jgi:fumarate hydratase class II
VVSGFTVNHAQVEQTLARNPILVTALNLAIGYEAAAAIAKRAYKEQRPIIDVAAEETGMARSKLKQLLDPARLAGIDG